MSRETGRVWTIGQDLEVWEEALLTELLYPAMRALGGGDDALRLWKGALPLRVMAQGAHGAPAAGDGARGAPPRKRSAEATRAQLTALIEPALRADLEDLARTLGPAGAGLREYAALLEARGWAIPPGHVGRLLRRLGEEGRLLSPDTRRWSAAARRGAHEGRRAEVELLRLMGRLLPTVEGLDGPRPSSGLKLIETPDPGELLAHLKEAIEGALVPSPAQGRRDRALVVSVGALAAPSRPARDPSQLKEERRRAARCVVATVGADLGRRAPLSDGLEEMLRSGVAELLEAQEQGQDTPLREQLQRRVLLCLELAGSAGATLPRIEGFVLAGVALPAGAGPAQVHQILADLLHEGRIVRLRAPVPTYALADGGSGAPLPPSQVLRWLSHAGGQLLSGQWGTGAWSEVVLASPLQVQALGRCVEETLGGVYQTGPPAGRLMVAWDVVPSPAG